MPAGEVRGELTDGFNLVVDALKLNGVETIYGVVGIPITDLARVAQAKGIRYHRVPSGAACRPCGGRGRVSDPASGDLPDGVGSGVPERAGGAGERHDELLPDDPDRRFERSGDRGPAAGRLRGAGPDGRGQAAGEGGLPGRAAARTSGSGWPGLSAPRSRAAPAGSTWTCPPRCWARRWTRRRAGQSLFEVVDPAPRQLPAPEAVDRALDLLAGAQRPLIVIGKGAAYARAEERDPRRSSSPPVSRSCRCRWPRACCPMTTRSRRWRPGRWRSARPMW